MRRSLAVLSLLALAATFTPQEAQASPREVIEDSVLAQAPEPPQPTVSVLPGLLDQLLSPAGLGTLVAILGTVAGLLLGPSAVRRRRVALAVYHAYHIVNDVDNERNDGVLDKPKEGLRAANEYMIANGWRPLKPGEEHVARLGFQSLHGEEIQRVKVQAAALNQALGAAEPPAALAAAGNPPTPLARR